MNIIHKAFFFLISIFVLTISVPTDVKSQIFDEQSHKITQFLNYMNNYYVDSINNDEVIEKAIVAMLKELDPHSVYISKEDVKAMNEPLQGNFDGIGIQFNILYDTVIVVSPIPGGPSEKVGIKAGDRIIEVEGENIAGNGITSNGVRERLLGAKGTKVNITVFRKDEDKKLKFTILRGEIPIFSIDASYMVDDEIGYIKLNRFAATTMKEFKNHFNALKKDGMKSLILDLRGNGGGYLNVAIDLVDEFVQDGKMVLYTEGLNSPKHIYRTNNKGSFEKGKLIVLINEGSASASEIVSGAIQDWDRGVLIGRRSFGKGLVQRPFNLHDGSMIRLTIARYYTPTGRLIQKPYNNGLNEYRQDINNRYTHGELSHKDSIQFPDSLKYYTLLKQREVYGGGGIMPDIFIPIDTSGYSDYYRNLVGKGIMNTFVLDYVDKNRNRLKNEYKDFKDYKNSFEVTNEMLTEMVEMAKKEEIEFVDEDFDISKEDIRIQTKALIARDIWDTSEYFQIMNTINASFKKAIEVLQDKTAYLVNLEVDKENKQKLKHLNR